MPTPVPATRTPRARPWPSAGSSTRAATPGPVVSRTAPTPTPAGRTPAPSSSASSTSTPPSRRPADRAPGQHIAGPPIWSAGRARLGPTIRLGCNRGFRLHPGQAGDRRMRSFLTLFLPGGFGLGPRVSLGGWLSSFLVPVPPDEPVHRDPPRDVAQAGDERDGQQQDGGR